jgi:hypothetical protein
VIAVALLVIGVVRSAFAANDAVDKPRLEKMLADGDKGMIVQVFKRHPGRTLPFIDRYLEGGLAMIEKGEDAAKALESFRMGIRFAELADKAFGGSTFADYANSFASWSPTEQKSFREGQAAFKTGMKEADAKKALKHLRRSLSLALQLGDAWGQAMAQQGIAEKALAAEDRSTASEAAVAAAELNQGLRLYSDTVESLLLAVSASEDMHGRYLAQAWTIAEQDNSIDPKLRKRVKDEYLAALEEAERTDLIEQIERSEAMREAVATERPE